MNDDGTSEAADSTLESRASTSLSDLVDSAESGTERLGAIDIVEAFTTLRQELKLQVRNGRELQQTLVDQLQSFDQRLQALAATRQSPATPAPAMPDESRRLVELIAELEEALQRAVATMAAPASTSIVASRAENAESQAIERFDGIVRRASWLAQRTAQPIFADLRQLLEEQTELRRQSEARLASAKQGLELLLGRVHRVMQQCQLERMDTVRQPFDSQTMQAIDLMDAPGVPSNHVAEQVRPGYRWRGQVLRCADVRLAR